MLAWTCEWTIVCVLLFIIGILSFVFVAVCNSIVKSWASTDDGTKYGNYVYYDYDSTPGCWAHNDSLYSVQIIRCDNLKITKDMNTDEGWKIDSYEEKGPDGSCFEHLERTEKRKNGLVFLYNFFWKDRCWWYPHHDVVRMLFDQQFFNVMLERAKRGDPEVQTLIGCCFGHNGEMSTEVVGHDIDKALLWWNMAAKQGYVYAMKELALYHWHRNEVEEAFKWNELSGRQVSIIYRDSRFASS